MLDDLVPHSPALNMAIDEVLLQSLSSPALRFYRWSEPCVSCGYFSAFDEACAFASGRPLVRRWTGGGIVPHGHDLTYSIIVPVSDDAFRSGSAEIYRRVHEALASALRALRLNARLAQTSLSQTSDACFANPVISDVLEADRKIAGAAHRKTRAGLLHQGSIQRDGLAEEFAPRFAGELCGNLCRAELDAGVLEAAERLALEKYGTEAWLRRH